MIAILADWFVKATVVLLLAAAVTVVLHRSAASLRHFVWTLACGGVLALPVASMLLPNWRVAGWPRLAAPTAFELHESPIVPAMAATKTSSASPAAVPTPVSAAESFTSATVDRGPVRWQIASSWTSLILPLWLSGVATVLLLLAVALARIVWLERTTAPLRDE